MNKEREKSILEILFKEEKIYVHDIALRLYASEPSIRRDLKNLEMQGFLKRIHGGAILTEPFEGNDHIPFAIREYEYAEEKITIAKKAAELVNDGDVIFLDSSSSSFAVIPYLSAKTNITIVTNSVKALESLNKNNAIKVLSTGGSLLTACLSLVGHIALRMLEEINANIAFISCRGVSSDGILTDNSIEENIIRQKMIERSEKQYALCTREKFGKKYLHNLCNISDITGILSESEKLSHFQNLEGENNL